MCLSTTIKLQNPTWPLLQDQSSVCLRVCLRCNSLWKWRLFWSWCSDWLVANQKWLILSKWRDWWSPRTLICRLVEQKREAGTSMWHFTSAGSSMCAAQLVVKNTMLTYSYMLLLQPQNVLTYGFNVRLKLMAFYEYAEYHSDLIYTDNRWSPEVN